MHKNENTNNFVIKSRKIILIIVLLTSIVSFFGCNEKTKINIEKSESYFNDFKIKNNSVTIYCTIVINNDSDKAYKIKLLADMEKDFKSGLYKEQFIYGINLEDGLYVFIIPPKSKSEFQVEFTGAFGGAMNQKQDRLIPPLSIEYCE